MCRNSVCCLASVLPLLSTGCSTVIKQSYYGVKGASGKFYEVKITDPATLAQYKRVKVTPFTNDLGPHVPDAMVSELNERAPAALAEERLFYPDGKTLRVTGRIVHYTGESGLKNSASNVVGRADCVCRMQLLDDDSGDLIGEAVCWGIVKSAVRRGEGELGDGVGKGIAKWIEHRLPEDELQARRGDFADE